MLNMKTVKQVSRKSRKGKTNQLITDALGASAENNLLKWKFNKKHQEHRADTDNTSYVIQLSRFLPDAEDMTLLHIGFGNGVELEPTWLCVLCNSITDAMKKAEAHAWHMEDCMVRSTDQFLTMYGKAKAARARIEKRAVLS